MILKNKLLLLLILINLNYLFVYSKKKDIDCSSLNENECNKHKDSCFSSVVNSCCEKDIFMCLPIASKYCSKSNQISNNGDSDEDSSLFENGPEKAESDKHSLFNNQEWCLKKKNSILKFNTSCVLESNSRSDLFKPNLYKCKYSKCPKGFKCVDESVNKKCQLLNNSCCKYESKCIPTKDVDIINRPISKTPKGKNANLIFKHLNSENTHNNNNNNNHNNESKNNNNNHKSKNNNNHHIKNKSNENHKKNHNKHNKEVKVVGENNIAEITQQQLQPGEWTILKSNQFNQIANNNNNNVNEDNNNYHSKNLLQVDKTDETVQSKQQEEIEKKKKKKGKKDKHPKTKKPVHKSKDKPTPKPTEKPTQKPKVTPTETPTITPTTPPTTPPSKPPVQPEDLCKKSVCPNGSHCIVYGNQAYCRLDKLPPNPNAQPQSTTPEPNNNNKKLQQISSYYQNPRKLLSNSDDDSDVKINVQLSCSNIKCLSNQNCEEGKDGKEPKCVEKPSKVQTIFVVNDCRDCPGGTFRAEKNPNKTCTCEVDILTCGLVQCKDYENCLDNIVGKGPQCYNKIYCEDVIPPNGYKCIVDSERGGIFVKNTEKSQMKLSCLNIVCPSDNVCFEDSKGVNPTCLPKTNKNGEKLAQDCNSCPSDTIACDAVEKGGVRCTIQAPSCGIVKCLDNQFCYESNKGPQCGNKIDCKSSSCPKDYNCIDDKVRGGICVKQTTCQNTKCKGKCIETMFGPKCL